MRNEPGIGRSPWVRPRRIRHLSILLRWSLFAIPLTLAAEDRLLAAVSLVDMVKSSLRNNPEILLQKEALNSSYADLEQARSVFDPVIGFSGGYANNIYPTATGPSQTTLQTTFSVARQLPIGISVTPAFSIQQTRTDPASAGSVANVAKSGVSLGIPLFAGLGAGNARLNTRRAAESGYRAAGSSYRYALATGVYQTATAYWGYVYACRMLKLYQELTRSAETQLVATKALAAADEIATQMVKQAQAYLDNARSSEVFAALQRRQAWDALMLTAGADMQFHDMLSDPSDQFPVPGAGFLRSLPDIDKLMTYAIAHRADLEASRQQILATGQLLSGARNQLQPDVRLDIWAGYSGWTTGEGFSGYISSLTDHLPGPAISATLTCTLPAGNRQNQAAYIHRLSDNETAKVRGEYLERRVQSSVGLALTSVRNAVSVYELSRRSAESYRALKEGELKKFRMGMSNIFNLQTSGNNLASAELQLLAAEKSFAQAILDLRYATATLIEDREEVSDITAADLTTLPDHGGQGK